MRLNEQVIAVTGSDQSYGRTVSSALAQAGASVILVGNHPETLAAHASNLEQRGGVAIPMQTDVSSPNDWLKAQNHILEIFGTLSGVVHLADRRAYSNLSLLSEHEWMELFNSNIKSTVGMSQLLQRYLPDTWLTIIGPHLDEVGFQVYPQRGALRGLVEQSKAAAIRVNMLFPSRASSNDDAADHALSASVLMLADPAMSHLQGCIFDVPLPTVARPQSPAEAVAWW